MNNQQDDPVANEEIRVGAVVAELIEVDGEIQGDGNFVPADPMEAQNEGEANIDWDFNQNIEVPILGFEQLRGRTVATISSYLFDLVREDCTCRSILSRETGCDRVVERCSQNPEEAFYVGHHGRIPLHEACLRGSCSHIIRSLLNANNVGAMERDNRGNTPLHLLFVDFSSRSIIDPQDMNIIVQLLLAVSPQIMAATANLEGFTPLHFACMIPETMIPANSLEQLIAANPSCAVRLNTRNQTALRLHCQRRNASVKVAKILLEANPDALTILETEDGWAPMHYAAANANLDLIRFLAETKPDAVSLRTTRGMTPLHLLCRQNPTADQLPIMNLLLRADPSSLLQRDWPNGFTPLHLLCKGSRISIPVFNLLLHDSQQVASVQDNECYLPLHHACEIGCDADIISRLLSEYPDGASACTRKQDSALSLACACNKSVDTVRLLIQANQDALVKKNDYGFAPLHCVCRAYQPRIAIVQALLDACPASITLKTNAGETPVHLACSNSGGFVSLIQLLTFVQNEKIGSAEDLILPTKSVTNKVGNTPCKYRFGSRAVYELRLM
jgi:ankyrin repeat protein